MDPLFPEMPEDLSALSDEDLQTLLSEHEAAAELIDKDDEDFIKGMGPDEVMAAYDTGVENIEKIVAEQKSRIEAQEAYLALKEEKRQRRLAAVAKEEEVSEEDDSDDEDDGAKTEEEEVAAVVAEAEQVTEEAAAEEETKEEEAKEEEPVLVTAAAAQTNSDVKVEVKETKKPALRRPPAPSVERQVGSENQNFLVAAAGLQELRAGQPLDRLSLAKAMGKEAGRYAAASPGAIQKVLMARAEITYPEERREILWHLWK